MSNPPAQTGLIQLADSAAGGIVLSIIAKRINEGKIGEKGALKLSTLANATRSKDIREVIRNLRGQGLIHAGGIGDLSEAETMIIRKVCYEVELAGPMNEDGQLEFDEEEPEIGFDDTTKGAYAKPNRLITGEDELKIAEGAWAFGNATYHYASDTSEEIIKATLTVRVGPTSEQTETKIEDKAFPDPVTAWAWFDEYVAAERAAAAGLEGSAADLATDAQAPAPDYAGKLFVGEVIVFPGTVDATVVKGEISPSGKHTVRAVFTGPVNEAGEMVVNAKRKDVGDAGGPEGWFLIRASDLVSAWRQVQAANPNVVPAAIGDPDADSSQVFLEGAAPRGQVASEAASKE